MPRSGLAPVGQRRLDLRAQDRPHALGQMVARLGVEVDGVEHRAPDVVLGLRVGGVADAHGPRVLEAREVVERLLGQVGAPVDPVHDLQVARGRLGHVGDEVEEVVRLPVEAERVQAPERERRVADPREAVVPVALPAGRLGQRRGRCGDDRAGRRVGQALERERRALQVRAPRVVGELAAVEPVLPVVRGPDQALVGLLVGPRRRVLAPGQGGEHRLALLHHVPRGGARALDAEVEIRHEPQLQVDVLRLRQELVVVLAAVLPGRALAPVVERGLARQPDLHLAVDAADHAQQDMVGVVVGRRAAVRAGAVVLVVPRADEQHVAHDDPAPARAPARLQHHRARQVAPAGRHLDARRGEPEVAGVAVQQRAEHAGRVHARQAEPLDAAVGRDERGGLAVGEEAVVGDRGERAA